MGSSHGKCPKCGYIIRGCELVNQFYESCCDGLCGTVYSFTCPSCEAALECETEQSIEMLANTIKEPRK